MKNPKKIDLKFMHTILPDRKEIEIESSIEKDKDKEDKEKEEIMSDQEETTTTTITHTMSGIATGNMIFTLMSVQTVTVSGAVLVELQFLPNIVHFGMKTKALRWYSSTRRE